MKNSGFFFFLFKINCELIKRKIRTIVVVSDSMICYWPFSAARFGIKQWQITNVTHVVSRACQRPIFACQTGSWNDFLNINWIYESGFSKGLNNWRDFASGTRWLKASGTTAARVSPEDGMPFRHSTCWKNNLSWHPLFKVNFLFI